MELHLTSGAFLRSKGFKAPTSKSKFLTWLESNQSAQAALLQERPDDAQALGLELEIPPALADLIAEGQTESTPELGRRVLDLNIHHPELERMLVEYPAAKRVLFAAIDAWRDQFVGAEEATARRIAELKQLNEADQRRAREAGNPIVLGFTEARAAERRRKLREMEAELDKEEARTEAARRWKAQDRATKAATAAARAAATASA